ncbi:carbonate dehydratase [Ferrimonas marina]|uniref:Carbonic anhydrase n=1 Tax=Ferrimonas marina TaxID=299255 RepID=A0A1M5Z4F6_9GAMM|nr:carbonate dehydratase [Ferrimonas marina]SHI19061.1 carbonic anhydrase [Ferrimonas marina]
MAELTHLFQRNQAWAQTKTDLDPEFFSKLANQQSPEYLWIGCSDSRVPANQIIDLNPGEVFVHRNIANVVVHSDLNALSVIQYAVDHLKVRHIMVVGHYGCGGVKAAMDNQAIGLAGNWVRHVRDVYESHREELESLPEETRFRRLCELNVIAQVINTCQTTIVRDAWQRGQELNVHGWIYDVADGLLNDLGMRIDSETPLAATAQRAILKLGQEHTE